METERLLIDPVRETDKADYFRNISHDKKVLETFICRYADTMETFDFSSYPGRRDLFAIRLKETGRLIGIILYSDEKAESCEIGYGIGSDYWGKGYATEAVRCFLEYLFRENGFRTVYASFFTGNDASRRVMEKCGMTFSRFSKNELTYLGVPRDLTYYKITKEGEPALRFCTLRDCPEQMEPADFSHLRYLMICGCGFPNSRQNFEPAAAQFRLCFPGRHPILTVPESPMFSAPEAAVVTEPRLALVRKAGHQFARTREIAPELIAEIGTPMIPEEQYAAIVNGGV